MHWVWLHHVMRGVEGGKAGFPVIKLRVVVVLKVTHVLEGAAHVAEVRRRTQ